MVRKIEIKNGYMDRRIQLPREGENAIYFLEKKTVRSVY